MQTPEADTTVAGWMPKLVLVVVSVVVLVVVSVVVLVVVSVEVLVEVSVMVAVEITVAVTVTVEGGGLAGHAGHVAETGVSYLLALRYVDDAVLKTYREGATAGD
jgi:hypothetical protein